MRWLPGLILLAVPACNFWLSDSPGTSDAAADAVDATLSDAARNCTTLEILEPVDDVEITEDNPTLTIDTQAVHNIRRTGNHTVLLLRFEPSVDLVDVSSGRLHVSYPALSTLCGGGGTCEPCDVNERAGTAELSWVTSAWVASEVHWNGPSDGADWAAPGLQGQEERSAAPVATTASRVGEGETLELDAPAISEAMSWLEPSPDTGNPALSAVIEVTSGTQMWVSTIDNDELCDGGVSFRPARLILERCE